MTAAKERIGALDGWRGLAILLVLIDHAGELSQNALIHKATRVGATGVGIFFALSGFLITSLLIAEKAKEGRIHLGRFFVRRVFRIVPSVVVFLATLLSLRLVHVLQVTNLQLVSCLLLFRNYIPSDWGAGWYTAHFWSLMVEEHFYLFWPLLFLLTRARVKVLAPIAVAVAIWRAVSMHYHLLPGPWAPGRTDLRIDALLWGCIAAILWSRPEWRERGKRFFTWPILLLLVVIDVGSNLVHGQHNYSWFEPIILALLVVWPVLHDGSGLRWFLDQRPLVLIGKVSYSLYIWQQLWMLFPGAPMLFPKLQAFPINIAVALCCGIASYLLVEKPCIMLGRRLTSRVDHKRDLPSFVA